MFEFEIYDQCNRLISCLCFSVLKFSVRPTCCLVRLQFLLMPVFDVPSLWAVLSWQYILFKCNQRKVLSFCVRQLQIMTKQDVKMTRPKFIIPEFSIFWVDFVGWVQIVIRFLSISKILGLEPQGAGSLLPAVDLALCAIQQHPETPEATCDRWFSQCFSRKEVGSAC